MNSPHLPPIASPPIASPDGNVASTPVSTFGGDWKSAPKIVRNWAFQLTYLGIALFLVMIFVAFFTRPEPFEQRVGAALFHAMMLGFFVWLNRGLRSGQSGAWVGQLILSCLGLLAFPLGTAIHGYILSQWFKPETKAWFGQN